MILLRLLLLTGLIALGAPAQAGDSMRCGSRLVQVEARAAEVLAACGAPAYRDVWAPDAYRSSNPEVVAEYEEWTYNFGSSQLLRTVRLRNARVTDIGTDGYGFSEPAPERRSCRPEQIAAGLSKYRLLMSCGAPLTRTVREGYRPLNRYQDPFWRGRDRNNQPLLVVFGEEWVYDFGPNLFMRVLQIENGRVVAVDNGARGSRRQ